MNRFTVVLFVAVLLSALYLVHIQYESRRIFVALEQANSEFRRLEIDEDRLSVEKRAQATPARVEKLAREKLKMRLASPAITDYINDIDPRTSAAGGQP